MCITKLAFQFINNLKTPICVRCSHFIEHNNIYTRSKYPSNKLGNCSKFGTKNLVTGKIEYAFAINCREDINKCGKDAIFFSKKILHV